MRQEDDLNNLVTQWLKKAEADYSLIERLAGEEDAFPEPIAFHAQQAVEKYLKAFLTSRQIYFPKTHDIRELLNLAGLANNIIKEELSECDILSSYGVEIRYPGDFPDVTIEDAKTAVGLAKKAKRVILANLQAE